MESGRPRPDHSNVSGGDSLATLFLFEEGDGPSATEKRQRYFDHEFAQGSGGAHLHFGAVGIFRKENRKGPRGHGESYFGSVG